jgi:hypothetical protein
MGVKTKDAALGVARSSLDDVLRALKGLPQIAELK